MFLYLQLQSKTLTLFLGIDLSRPPRPFVLVVRSRHIGSDLLPAHMSVTGVAMSVTACGMV